MGEWEWLVMEELLALASTSTLTRSPPTHTSTMLLMTTVGQTSKPRRLMITAARQGSYSVALPDGRIQHVNYRANDAEGYVAEVVYDGVAAVPAVAAVPVVGHRVVGHGVGHGVVGHGVVGHGVVGHGLVGG